MNDVLALANATVYDRDLYESDDLFYRFVHSSFTGTARPTINILDSIYIKRQDINN